MIHLDNNSSDDFGGIQILFQSQELSFAHQLTRLPFTRLSSSSCWAWVGGSRCWLSIIVSISPQKWLFFCFIHLVVVFHNCGRNRLRVFGRSGLAIPWRFHVWRGGKMNDYVKRGLLLWWGRKTRVRCWMTCVCGGWWWWLLVCGGGKTRVRCWMTCVCGRWWWWLLVCGGGGTLCTGLELEDGRVLLPAPWFPPPFTCKKYFWPIFFCSKTDLLLYTVKYRRLLLSDVIWWHVTSLHPGVLHTPPGTGR